MYGIVDFPPWLPSCYNNHFLKFLYPGLAATFLLFMYDGCFPLSPQLYSPSRFLFYSLYPMPMLVSGFGV